MFQECLAMNSSDIMHYAMLAVLHKLSTYMPTNEEHDYLKFYPLLRI